MQSARSCHAWSLVANLRSCAAACRSIEKKLAQASKLPAVRKTWTVEDKLGGWGVAQDKFFAGKARSPPVLKVTVRVETLYLSVYSTLWVEDKLGGWGLTQDKALPCSPPQGLALLSGEGNSCYPMRWCGWL